MRYSFLLFLLISILACKPNTETDTSTSAPEIVEETTEKEKEKEKPVKREPHYIEGKNWVLQSYIFEGKELLTKRLEEQPRIEFKHNIALGNTSCNTFKAQLNLTEVEQGKIGISNIGRTKKRCQGASMPTERHFVALLESAQSFDNNLLQLNIDCGETGKLSFLYKEKQ